MTPLIRSLLSALLLCCGLLPALAQESPAEALPSPTDLVGVEAKPAPPPCGTQLITIARMQWPTAAILANIHARILTAEFGCQVRIQEGDMAATGSSMGSTGQPAVAPELWISRVAEIWNAALKSQKVRQAGSAYAESGFESWFVPDYVAAQWPEVTTIEGLRAHAVAFGQNGKGRFISCPVDWACSVVNRNLLKANGLDSLFEIIEPANRFELDTLIGEAVSRKEPILFYYWQPNAILAQFGFKPVDLGAYDRDAFLCLGRRACATPMPSGFPADPVIVALAEWVYLDAPQIAAYFQRAKMPFAEMNAMLQQLSEAGATVESVADRFIAERGDIWRPWLGIAPAPVQ